MDENIDVAVDTNTEGQEDTQNQQTGDENTPDLAIELEKQRKANLDISIRAKKAEAELKILKQRSQLKVNDEPDREIVKSVKRLEELENKRQFGFENGLAPEETDFVFKITGGKPDKDILQDPFVKSGLEGYRSKKRLESNTPSPSSSSSPFRGKQFKEMSEDEKKRAFEEASPLNKK
jgi:hypothetical protein